MYMVHEHNTSLIQKMIRRCVIMIDVSFKNTRNPNDLKTSVLNNK
jgi:hypothetical protein